MSNKKLSTLAETLVASEIVRLGATIKEKIKAGNNIYNYTIGDFDSAVFPIPKLLEQYIADAYKEGYTTYPAAPGEADLRRAVANFVSKKSGISLTENEVLISNGGRPLIYAAYRILLDEGDKVIYPIPSWNNNHYTNFNNAEHITIQCSKENNFMPTAEQIAPFIKDATLLSLCSPLNPTGTVFTKETLEAICDLVIEENKRRGPEEKKLFVLYDQIYWMLTYGDTVHHSPVSVRSAMKDYTIYIDGISKAFAATGVRVGWAIGPEYIIDKMKSLNSHIGSWAPMAEQKAVAKFLSNEEDVDKFLLPFKTKIAERLEKFYNGFNRLREKGYAVDAVPPQAAIYLTVQLNLTGKKTETGEVLDTQSDVTAYILNDAQIALVPFSSFGADKNNSWYRLSVGTCKVEDIESVMTKFTASLDKLK